MTIRDLYKRARRIAVFAVGSTVLLMGIVLLVTPGPALVVIPIGLAILAVEFSWARRWLRKIRRLFETDDDRQPPDVPSSPSSVDSTR
jgi:uncharacterized protein (TIGR02611 family)